MKKTKATLLAICALFPSQLYAQSLEETLTSAYTYSFEIRAQRENSQAADEGYLQAMSGWLPTITASGSRSRVNQHYRGQKTDSPSGSDQIVVSQPLFNGGSTIGAMQSARAVVDQAQLTLFSTEQRLLLDAVQAHANVIQAKEILRVSQHTENVLLKQLDLVEVQFKAGEVTKTDVAQVKKRLSQRISQRITAESEVAKAIAAYDRLTGELPVDLKSIDYPALPLEMEDVLQKALAANPDLHISRKRWDQAKYDAHQARGSLLPEVSLQGSKSWNKYRSLLSDRADDTSTMTVNVSIPIFQGGKNYAGYRKARDLQEAARENSQATHYTLIRSVSDTWHDLQSAFASIIATKSAIEAADLALKSIMEEFRAGARSTLDVLDTERELFEEEVSLVREQTKAVIQSYTILSLMGELSAKKLGLDVETYDPEDHFKKTRFKLIGLK